MRRAPITMLLASVVLGLPACGGDDEGDVKKTVREFIEATRSRDANAWCGKLVTRDFLEQATGATGREAQDACRKQIKSARAPDVRLTKVGKPSIDGDKATVVTTLEEQGQPRPQVFRLKKEGGDWRLTSGGVG
jgi:hypothetical protein